MNTTHTLKNIFAGALLSGLAVTGMGLTVGTAAAQHSFVPQTPGLMAEDGPVPPGASGPYQCCPGDQTGGLHPQTGRGCPGPEVH